MNRREEIRECDLAYEFINDLMTDKLEGSLFPHIRAIEVVMNEKLSIHRFLNEVKDIISYSDKKIVKNLLEVWKEANKQKEEEDGK